MINPAPIASWCTVATVVSPGTSAAGVLVMDPAGAPWLEGLAHPLISMGHLAVILTLGFAAAEFSGRTRWTLLLMFAALLTTGIVLGLEGAAVPMLDTIVLTTGLCFGLLVLGQVRLAFATIASIAGAFALFHGLGDGYEFGAMKTDAVHVAGYAIGNLVLYVLGLSLGEWVRRHQTLWAAHTRDLFHHSGGSPHGA